MQRAAMLLGVSALLGVAARAEAQDAVETKTELPVIEVTVPAAPQTAKAPRKKAVAAPPGPVSARAPAEADSGEAETSITETTAGPVDGYRALTAASATKTDTPIAEIPQSIQVIPRSLIEDQTALSVDEIARNVSGVIGTPRLQTPSYDSGRIRGFFSEQRLDGLPTAYSPGHRDGMAHIERVEVLKGPNALLYGGGFGGVVGGTLNIVSKQPFEAARLEFGATVGSHSTYRPYFDINQPLAADGSVLLRMTGEYLDAGSFVDHIETESYALNPTLELKPGRDTTLTVQGRLMRWEQPEYQGLPAMGTVAGDFRFDPTQYIGALDAPDSFSAAHGVTVTLDHAVSDSVDATIKSRWTQSEMGHIGQVLVGGDGLPANEPLVGPSWWLLSNGAQLQEQDEFVVAADVRLRASGDWHTSTLVVGADYSRVAGSGSLHLDALIGGAGFLDPTTPTGYFPYVRPPHFPQTTFWDAGIEHVSQGAHVQVQSTVADRVHLLAGVRLADVAVALTDHIDGTQDAVRETRVLPRIGAVVDLVGGLSAYADYSEGLTGHHPLIARGLPEPEALAQREAGVKFESGTGLSGTAALFQVDREGVPVVVNALMVGTSVERARGFELDVIWQPTAALSVLGSYAHIDARVREATAVIAPGARRMGVPEHSGRLWINYAFDAPALAGWSAGVGIYAASEQAVDLANRFFTDSYMTLDAKIAYATDDFTVTASAKNLLDESYFVSYYYLGGRVAQGDERAFYLTVSRTY